MKFDLCLARDNAAKHHIEFFMGEETAKAVSSRRTSSKLRLEQRRIFAKKSNIFLMGCAYFPLKVWF
jgi:hypothetical protein